MPQGASAVAIMPAVSGSREPSPTPHLTTYEELEGGKGREIFFRPERYRRADLGHVDPVVAVSANGVSHDCELVDISQNGLAFSCLEGLSVSPGDHLDSVVVTFDGHEVFRGEGRVVSVRVSDTGPIVGICFADGLVSIEDVLVLRDLRAFAKDESTSMALTAQRWYVGGHERFKSLVGDLGLLFRETQTRLTDLEKTLPFQVVHGDIDTPARAALVEWLMREFVEPVVRCTEEIDASVRGASTKDLPALKEFSVRQLNDIIMMAPIMSRARHKPLGYAGDFEVMRYMYERQFEGTNLFSKALNLVFTHTTASRAVRARKNMLKQELRSRISLSPANSTTPLRILAIAAGPAQEIYELLQEVEALPRPLEIVLLDQERQALSYAYTRLKRTVDTRWPNKVSIHYRYDTIRKLLADRSCIGDLGEFDFVYASGLYDYLGRSSAVRLTSNLYRHVGRGGSLFIGNMSPNNPSRWLMEHHLDWFLLYRTHEEMLDFATAGAEGADVGIVEEQTGVNPFVRAIRR